MVLGRAFVFPPLPSSHYHFKYGILSRRSKQSPPLFSVSESHL